ncbi:MAG: hypothetical protein M1816_000433 [Peltula sp. TS41687]|nr:MAG: hypothetical protein M1816_000433 [Peltula sp. TS41687]
MDVDETAQYNDSNRAFLQAFLARGSLTFKEARPILAAIFTAYEGKQTRPQDVSEGDFNSYVSAANDAISPFDLSIRSTLSQHDRTRIYALVNTTSDPITQLATTHTADEISFLKRLLDAMFETFNTTQQEVMAINSMQAVRLHKPSGGRLNETQNGSATQESEGQGLTMVGAEKMLKDLVQEGWFEKSTAGFYSLSARALIELEHYLLSTYNVMDEDEEMDERERRQDKVKLCAACKEIVTIGQRCPKKNCPCRIHNICTEGLFKAQNAKRCPSCKTQWTGADFVGEKAVTTTEAYLRGRRRSGAGGGPRQPGGRGRREVVEADEEEEESDAEEEE